MSRIEKHLSNTVFYTWFFLCVFSTSALAATVVEFYNTNLDHYFITADTSEAAAIDNGSAGSGWSRTGNTFAAGGGAPVCRFYGSQLPGPNSHFYTVDAAECEGLKQLQASTPVKQKRWNFESLDFYSTPPTNGTCLGGTVPVYRAYNNGFTRGIDSNHRITSSPAAIQEVVNRGWNNEGVVMCAPIQTTALVRSTQFGQVAGVLDTANAAYAWLGIPYASPPVGALRWMAPMDPIAWTATRSAQQRGSACMQAEDVGDKALGIVPQSEDCLTLNIWSPSTGETNLPVLVFVHGGSNVIGYGGMTMYGGAKLASEQKVVFVSVNYRLNLFGWLNHLALKTGDPVSDSGNFGTLDLIQALKFVRNNIGNFGGNPDNVTLSGQSAGSEHSWSLIASPKAAGLFHKAVALSTGLFGVLPTDFNVTTFAANLLRQLVIDDGKASSNATADIYIAGNLSTYAQQKAYLYGKSASALISAFSSPNVSAYPTVDIFDGVVLPPGYAQAFTGSFLNNVPVISGITNEEGKWWGTYFMTSAEAWSAMYKINPDKPGSLSIGDIIQSQYLPANKPFVSCSNTGYNAVTLNAAYDFNKLATYCINGLHNTTSFWDNQADTLNRYQPLQQKTFAYNFAWAQQPEPMKTVLGAAHVTDIPLMFGNMDKGIGGLSAGYSQANKPGREALSQIMRNSLAVFMRTGDPNNASLGITWLPWSSTPGQAKRLVFNADYNNASISMSTTDTPIPVP